MRLTLQQFRRRLGEARRAAAAGTEVLIKERSGATYVFKSSAAAVGKRSKAKTFGEMFGHFIGSVKGGPADLSTNKKYLDDFGRKSMGRG